MTAEHLHLIYHPLLAHDIGFWNDLHYEQLYREVTEGKSTLTSVIPIRDREADAWCSESNASNSYLSPHGWGITKSFVFFY